MQSPRIYLASLSPRRHQLLEQIGVSFETLAVEVEETPANDEVPSSYTQRLAVEKATAGWNAESRGLLRPVLGADTCIVLDDEIVGKPADCLHAMEILARLSGRAHQVLSAVALVYKQHRSVKLCSTSVWFREISPKERAAYCASGEPLDKAGAYAIQGRGAAFVSRIDGSYTGVMGLPLFETAELLTEFNIPILTR